jgi:GMP synthase PP-ATPase subunit
MHVPQSRCFLSARPMATMGHVDLKSMEPYQHQELEPLREIIDQRNQRKKFGQVFGQVLENEAEDANDTRSLCS